MYCLILIPCFYYIPFCCFIQLLTAAALQQAPYIPIAKTRGFTAFSGKKYRGKENKTIGWKKIQAEESGFIPLTQLLKPNERTIAYGLVYVFSSKNHEALMLVGSDDGVRIWLNEKLVHSNPAYRGAYPDQDKVPVELKQGWNKLLVKVLQGGGGWGFYLRFVDPEEKLRWSTEFKK